MRRVPVIFLLAFVALLTLAGPALAHTELAELSPADGSGAKTAPAAVTLTFTQEVDERLATVTVRDASGATVASGQPQRNGLALLQPVANLASGRYDVQWRAAAADGHILRGEYSFRVGATGGADGSQAEAAPLTPSEQLLAAHKGPNHKDKPAYAISAADRRKASKPAAADAADTSAAAPLPAAPAPDNGSATIVTLLGAALAVVTTTAVVESVRAHRV